MVSERFPSGLQVVSEWFPSGFGVFQTCPKTCPEVCPGFLGPQICPEGFPEVCPGVCPWLLGPQSCPEGCPGVCPGSCPADFVLKAVRRVVRGVCPGGCPGFTPAWTQNVKTGVYAEPPLSIYIYIFLYDTHMPSHRCRRWRSSVGQRDQWDSTFHAKTACLSKEVQYGCGSKIGTQSGTLLNGKDD